LMSLAGGALTAVQVIGIQAATEGNPLFVEHSYLYTAESEGLLGGVRARSQASYTEEDLELAQSVRGLIGRRLERLSEPAHRMLIASAVIRRDFDDAMRTSSFLAQAAKNALAVGAYEEVLRLIESTLMLLPADKTKDRAAALPLRGDAFAGLGRRDEARSAWGVAAQRFEDSGDKR